MLNRRYLYGQALMLLILSAIYAASFWMSSETRHTFFHEGGPIEIATVAAYLLIPLLLLAKNGLRTSLNTWYLLALPLLLAMREMDFDKRFTSMGLFKSRLYLSLEHPLWEQLLGLAVLSLLGLILFLLVKRHGWEFIAGLKARSAVATSIFLSMALMAISKTIDGLPRKLGAISVSVGNAMGREAGAIEEVMELGIPLAMILAVLAAWRGSNASVESAVAEPVDC